MIHVLHQHCQYVCPTEYSNRDKHTYIHTYIHTYSTYIHTYIHTYIQYIHTYMHTYIQMIASSSACWMISRRLIIEADSYLIYSRTLIHPCMYIWMCGRQYMVVVEERGQGQERGRLTLFLASRWAPLSRSTFATSAWPLWADQMRAVLSHYQRQTHTVRERHLAMDDTTHHSQAHMQRDMAYTDTRLYSASLCMYYVHVCMYVWMNE